VIGLLHQQVVEHALKLDRDLPHLLPSHDRLKILLPACPRPLDCRFYEEKEMMERRVTKLIRVGEFAAEVEVELLYTDDDWAPYLSVEDVTRLDEVRQALEAADIERALRLSRRVYRLLPVAA